MDAVGGKTKPRPSPGRGPRGGRQQVEERVLVAAQRLFAEHGFRVVTVRDIAAEAGVSHALVHRYLGSKEAILAAVLRGNEAPMLELASGSLTASDAALAMFRELHTSRPEYLRLLARVIMDDVAFETTGHRFRALQKLIELLQADAAQRGRKLPEPRVIAAALTALLVGWSVGEDWLSKAAGLADLEPSVVEASLEALVVSMVGSAAAPQKKKGKKGRPGDRGRP